MLLKNDTGVAAEWCYEGYIMVSVKACKVMLATILSLLLVVCIAIIYIVITDYNEASTPFIQIESNEVPLGMPEDPGYLNFD